MRLALIASSNDFLVEESVREAVAAACESLGAAEPEVLATDVTPEQVAVELRSPSLFAPTRVLVVPEARWWLETTAPAGALDEKRTADVDPLLQVLGEGVPEGTALVMGAWCGRKPRGPLVKAVQDGGDFQWVAVPEPPKPWEDVQLSADQRRVLSRLLGRVAGETRFEPAAASLLMERLGFDPRRLVQEASKLATAAGTGVVDEALVRRLTLPRERSLEVVRDAVLQRDAEPLLELVAAAAAGQTVNDWQGRPMSPSRLGIALCGQLYNLMLQLLFLRRLAVAGGVADQLSPVTTAGSGWYRSVFTPKLAPALTGALGDPGVTPIGRKGKAPTPWTLGQLYRGASRYEEDELVAAIAGCGELETAQRGALGLEALTAWIVSTIGARA